MREVEAALYQFIISRNHMALKLLVISEILNDFVDDLWSFG